MSTEASSAVRRPMLEVRGLRKAFPGLRATNFRRKQTTSA